MVNNELKKILFLALVRQNRQTKTKINFIVYL